VPTRIVTKFGGRSTIDPMGETLFSIQGAADVVGCSPQTIRRWERSGRIPRARRISGQRRYSEADLDQLVRLVSGLPQTSPVKEATEWEQPDDEPDRGEPETFVESLGSASPRQRDEHGQPVHTELPSCPHCGEPVHVITRDSAPHWVCSQHGSVVPSGPDLRLDSFVSPPPGPQGRTRPPRRVPLNPFGLDEDVEDVERSEEWRDTSQSAASRPACPGCGERVTRVNDAHGRLVWTCGAHTSERPKWIQDPSARTSRGPAAFALVPDPSPRRARGLTLGDIQGALRAPRSQPKAAASYLDPPPRSARPS
jgi:DNA-binding transcriptional MerR regulator